MDYDDLVARIERGEVDVTLDEAHAALMDPDAGQRMAALARAGRREEILLPPGLPAKQFTDLGQLEASLSGKDEQLP